MMIVYSTRRNWQKKYCSTSMMGFTMANSHVSICISLYLQILLYFVVLKLFVSFIVFIFVFLLLVTSS